MAELGPGKDIWRVTAGVYPSNAYICATGDGGCFLIDPGLGGEDIDAQVTALGLTPRAIYCTHGHFDHVGSCAFFQKNYNIEVFLHKDDEKLLKTSNFLLTAFSIPQRIELPQATFVSEGFSCTQGRKSLRFYHSPGHTPGSCVIEWGEALFTGDTLYTRGVGLSRLRGEEPEVLKRTILKLFNTFPQYLEIFPGHGGSAKLEDVRLQNHALLDFLGLERSGDSQPEGMLS
jgi:glyoxylase-like metal-dependent hydrolase (beta-lactamase superfamily II)